MRDSILQPLTWVWLALAWLGFRAWRNGRRPEAAVVAATLALLTLCGGTPFPAWCLARLELRFARPPGSFPAPADAVVMLGGGHSASSWESTGIDASPAFNRALAAWQLVRNGVSTNLVLGGGSSPTRSGPVSDGQRLAAWLRASGETRASIRVLPGCRTTDDEARESALLSRQLGWTHIVVVTSAWHLPRALAAFKAEGIDAEGFGADFRGLDGLERGTDWSVFPAPGPLLATQRLLHELVGRVGYWLTGKGTG